MGPTEFRLLHFFMTHPERVYSRSQLLDRVWGRNTYVEERTVDVHILRLRKALASGGYDRCVQTVRGAGYRFSGGGDALSNPWTVEIWRLAGFRPCGAGVRPGCSASDRLDAAAGPARLYRLATRQLSAFLQLDPRRQARASRPSASGVWAELINEQYRLLQRSRRRKKKIAKL
jgi:hypothetical protein